jgi:hypothetical protein
MSLVLSFIKYYSLCPLNSEEILDEVGKKNMEKLENQVFVKLISLWFGKFMNKVKRAKIITLYSYTLL